MCFYDLWSISAQKQLKFEICHLRFKGSRSSQGQGRRSSGFGLLSRLHEPHRCLTALFPYEKILYQIRGYLENIDQKVLSFCIAQRHTSHYGNMGCKEFKGNFIAYTTNLDSNEQTNTFLPLHCPIWKPLKKKCKLLITSVLILNVCLKIHF